MDAALSELYEYDPLDRLVSFQRGAPTASPTLQQSWDLDALGNWSGITTGGTTTSREFNVDNQTTAVSGGTAPTYDAVGNTTSKDGHEYAYDAWGRLASVKAAGGGSTLAIYTYDALGRRAVETYPGLSATHVYFTPDWRVIEERIDAVTHLTVLGATGQIVFRDVYALGALGEDWRYYPRQNANGDIVALVKGAASSAGYVLERHAYEPYGSMLVMAGDGTPRPGGTAYSWRVFFQGGRLDNVSGLYNFQFRDYDPHTGTWMTRDPIGLAGGDPNLYRFVANNPVNFVDPSGLAGQTWTEWVSEKTRVSVGRGAVASGLAVPIWAAKTAINAGKDLYNEASTVWRNTGGGAMSTPRRVYTTGGTTAATITGVRQISDAITGCDAVDARAKSPAERIYDGTTGTVSLVFTAAGGYYIIRPRPRPVSINPAAPECPAIGAPSRPLGARGPASGRDFDPSLAGGPIRRLTTDRIKITNRGIDAVEQHVGRFGPDAANQGMVQRLRDITAGRLQPTQTDLNFYSHELRESVRYRQLGWRNGQPSGADAAYDLWNNAHTATLEDYLLREGPGVLYHRSVIP